MIVQNPFPEADLDRHSIWEMLVRRDIRAFLSVDWSMIADDFIEEGFMGIDGGNSENPDNWKFSFPDLNLYKAEWLKQAASFKENDWAEDPGSAMHRVTDLSNIEIHENVALARKKFDGHITKSGGEKVPFQWQTLYFCRKVKEHWKIAGFTGYLPYVFNPSDDTETPRKRLPSHAVQHSTAGPYSPVLVITPGELVVTSGQAAIDLEGGIIGDTIEEQAAYTLENCRKVLRDAGCSMADVFKVNVYMKDLDEWSRFNEVYKKYFDTPMPVRTAVQAVLLSGLLVEIELWAAKKNL